MLVLFDIDGTLLTSNGAGRSAIEAALSRCMGRAVTAEGVAFSGRTDPAIVRDMLAGSGCTTSEIDASLADCLEAYADELTARLQPSDITVLDGVTEILSSLRIRPDTHLALLTGNLERTAWAKLHAGGLNDYFEWGAFGSDHHDRNQLPGIAAHRFRERTGRFFPSSRTIIIGDTEHDITCARSGGAWAIAVCTGRSDRRMLEIHGPDLLLDSLAPMDPVLAFMDTLPA
ncbi:MAG: haloacid dehalogenase-like hydrolase [Rhodothermales bacterium]